MTNVKKCTINKEGEKDVSKKTMIAEKCKKKKLETYKKGEEL